MIDTERLIQKEQDMHPYPILALINQALGTAGPGFATDDNAASLESYARALADEYWSETVWLTGRITDTAFRLQFITVDPRAVSHNGRRSHGHRWA